MGAGFAYKNEREAKKKERRDADIGAALETTLYLQRMWNEVFNYRKQIIEPVRSEEIRFIAMRPTIKIEATHEMPWSRLVFLMEKFPNLVVEISNVQFAFQQFFEFVKIRSEQHIREVQPKLATGTDIQPTEEFMRNLLGKQLFQSMKNNTEEIIQYADRLFEDFSPLVDKLRKATTDLYCDANIPICKLSESDTTDEPNSSG